MKEHNFPKKPENNLEKTAKPPYIKPAVVASHSEEDLGEEFSTLVGATHVDLFGP